MHRVYKPSLNFAQSTRFGERKIPHGSSFLSTPAICTHPFSCLTPSEKMLYLSSISFLVVNSLSRFFYRLTSVSKPVNKRLVLLWWWGILPLSPIIIHNTSKPPWPIPPPQPPPPPTSPQPTRPKTSHPNNPDPHQPPPNSTPTNPTTLPPASPPP